MKTDSVFCATIDGQKIWCRNDTWDLAIASDVVLNDEYGIRPIFDAGHNVECVVDIGAHIGSFAALCKSFWPGCRYYGFEPNPNSFELLSATRDANAWRFTSLTEAALMPDDYQFPSVSICCPTAENTGATFVWEMLRRFDPRAVPAGVLVRSAPAMLCKHAAFADEAVIDILKLDCEGSEGHILESLAAAGVLKKTRWIRGEWHGTAMVALIENALKPTHEITFTTVAPQLGKFVAHSKTIA